MTDVIILKIDYQVNEGQVLEFFKECKVISTPGHTPGHISIYVKDIDAAIAGDTAVIENRKLKIANPSFCFDIDKAEKSLKKITNMNVKRIICYHGGEYIMQE